MYMYVPSCGGIAWYIVQYVFQSVEISQLLTSVFWISRK